jgi:hypothetical protein
VKVNKSFHEKRLEENIHIAYYLKTARSSYEREKLLKEYEDNHAKLPAFNGTKTPQTAIYLGLLSTKELMKKTTSAKTLSPDRNQTAEPQHGQTNKSKTSARPFSANDVKRIHNYIKKAKESARPTDPEKEFKALEQMITQRRAPSNERWDSSPNDFLHNSNYNHKNFYSRDQTIYRPGSSGGDRRSSSPNVGGMNYLIDRSIDILTLSKQKQQEELERQQKIRFTQERDFLEEEMQKRQTKGKRAPEQKQPDNVPLVPSVSIDSWAAVNDADARSLSRPQSAPILLAYNSPTKQTDGEFQQQAEAKMKSAKSATDVMLEENAKITASFHQQFLKAKNLIGAARKFSDLSPKRNVSFQENVAVREFKGGEMNRLDFGDIATVDTSSTTTKMGGVATEGQGEEGYSSSANNTSTFPLFDPRLFKNQLSAGTLLHRQPSYHQQAPQLQGVEETTDNIVAMSDLSRNNSRANLAEPTRSLSMMSNISEITLDEDIRMDYQAAKKEMSRKVAAAAKSTDLRETKDPQVRLPHVEDEVRSSLLKNQIEKSEYEEQLKRAHSSMLANRNKRDKSKRGGPDTNSLNDEELLLEDELFEALNVDLVSHFQFPTRCDNICNSRILAKKPSAPCDVRNLGKVAFMIYEIGYCIKGSKENYQIAHDYPNLEELQEQQEESLHHLMTKLPHVSQPSGFHGHVSKLFQHPPDHLEENGSLGSGNNPHPVEHHRRKTIHNHVGHDPHNLFSKPLAPAHGPAKSAADAASSDEKEKDVRVTFQLPAANEEKEREKEKHQRTVPSPLEKAQSARIPSALSPPPSSNNNSFLNYNKLKNQNLDTSNAFLLTCTGILVAVYLLPHDSDHPTRHKTSKFFSLESLYELLQGIAENKKSPYCHQASDLVTIFDEIFSFGYPYGDMSYQPMNDTPVPPHKLAKQKTFVNRTNFMTRQKSFNITAMKKDIFIDEKAKGFSSKGAMIYPCLADMTDQENMMALLEILMSHLEIRKSEDKEDELEIIG